MSVDVFQPSHLETKFFLKHELNWFALYSMLHAFAQLYSTGCFPIKVPAGLRYYGNSGLRVTAVKPP